MHAVAQFKGHSHVVIELIDSLTSTTVTDPTKFAFFKGLNDPAQNGILSATVPGGLPAGVYKVRLPSRIRCWSPCFSPLD